MKYVLLISLLFAQSLFAQEKINGAGATFPYPIYSKWFTDYSKIKKSVEFNYQSIGSGGGIKQLINQTVDFAASDAPMSDDEMKQVKTPVMHVPTVIGAVTVAFNLPGITELKLDGETVSSIYLGTIAKWNDPAIAKLNPGVKLPATDILVIRRSDGSGTTSIFTNFLSSCSDVWKNKVGAGKSVNWLAGVGAKGNEGVTALISQTEGAIGYVELAFAVNNKLSIAQIKNKAGEFVKPTVEAISKSAAGVKNFEADPRISIINMDGKGVYPISSFTYILLPVVENTKIGEVKAFLKWALTEGQKSAASLYYAPLPANFSKAISKKL